MRAVALTVFALAAALAAGRMVSLQTCDDSLNCKGARCSTQNISTGVCYSIEGSLMSLTVECSASRDNLFIKAASFTDSHCNVGFGALNALCGTCQDNFTFSCGALANGIFWAVNCTDTACNDCGGATIVDYGKCTEINPGVWGLAQGIHNCTAVTVKFFSGSNGCGGQPQYSRRYPSTECLVGTTFTCAPASEGELAEPQLKLAEGVQRHTIKVDPSFLKSLPLN